MQYKDYAQSEKNLGEYINTLMLICCKTIKGGLSIQSYQHNKFIF